MSKALLFGVFMSVILLIATGARSDVGAASDPTAKAVPDPSVPATMGQTDPGPASALWHYTDLPPGEQAWVDRNRDTTGWDHTNQAFAQGAAEQAQTAAARDAASQLGVENLGTEGVTP